MFKSKLVVAIALVAVIFIIGFTFTQRVTWWSFIDVFCFFMAAFTQLMALTLGAKIPSAGKKFSVIALVFAIAGIVALIVETILWHTR
ncbi:MAG: hypothetical protein NC402_05565 [Prevotella sp.]|nr:hypothetical protein [Prevotella sp.]MCM1075229.1 hypothetical protein [Ruminococcus sp.]